MKRNFVTLSGVALCTLSLSCAKERSPIETKRDADGKVHITIDEKQIRDDAHKVIEEGKEAGREAIRETGESLEKAGKALQDRE